MFPTFLKINELWLVQMVIMIDMGNGITSKIMKTLISMLEKKKEYLMIKGN